MLPLATDTGDLLVGITAALAELQPDELGLFQVIFQPVQHPWAESMVHARYGQRRQTVLRQPTGISHCQPAENFAAVVWGSGTSGRARRYV